MMLSKPNTKLFNAGIILLLLTVIAIFVLPLLPQVAMNVCYPFFFFGIFLMSALSLKQRRKLHVKAALTLTGILLATLFTDMVWLRLVSRCLQFLYFFLVVIALVRQIASTKEVNRQVILTSITAYFLLGFAFTMLVMLVAIEIPGSYNFEAKAIESPERYESLRDITYYTFVTYTTAGYGDLVPLKPISKSLAILISSSCQLYVAIIIAMLVGKYTTSRT